MAVDVDHVSTLVHHVATTTVLPRWQALADDDVYEKAPGEVVTSVDREAEALLTEGLRRLLPRALVVGEEAAAADRALLSAVGHAPLVWLVDPLDGTRNFIDGSPDFAVMVALVERGQTAAAWINRPAVGRSYTAVRGAGAFAGERRLRVSSADEVAALRGEAMTRFLDDDQRRRVASLRERVAALGPGRGCAGVDYPLIAEAEQDFVLFWRTLPWDHASGALLVTEAGGVVAYLDGAPYRPTSRRQGLVAAAGPTGHAAVAHALSG